MIPFNSTNIDKVLRNLANIHFDGKLSKIMIPYRLALTGKTSGPSISICSEILGKDEVLKRLQDTINHFQTQNEKDKQ